MDSMLYIFPYNITLYDIVSFITVSPFDDVYYIGLAAACTLCRVHGGIILYKSAQTIDISARP